jgi:tetratricopeptide (TPR) repeat protein
MLPCAGRSAEPPGPGQSAAGIPFDWTKAMCDDVKQPFFAVARILRGGTKKYRANRMGANPASFVMPKPAGIKRVFLIGESVAQMSYSPRHDALESLMSLAGPAGIRPENINAGMGGYESSRILLVEAEVLGYDPDMIVVMNGNNESALLREICPSILQRIQQRFSRIAAYRDFQDKVQRLIAWSSGPQPRTLEFFETNLRQMVRLAKERRTPIVLCKLPANLNSYAPWGAAPIADPDFARAWARMEAKDDQGAAELLDRYLRRRSEDSFAHYFLARILERQKRFDEARRHYEQAMEQDIRNDRCSPSKNAVIEKVANEEGAYLADLDAAFERAAPNGIAGDELISDGVHWYQRYTPLTAFEILRAVLSPLRSAQTVPFDAQSWKAAALETARDSVEHPRATKADFKRDRQLWLLNGTVMLEQWAGDRLSDWGDKTGDGAILERGISMLERIYRRDPDWLLASTRSKKGLRKFLRSDYFRQDPAGDLERWWPLYLQHVAELYRRMGRPADSIPLFDAAIALSPERKLMRFQRAMAYLDLNDEASATRDLDAVGGLWRPVPGLKALVSEKRKP